MKRTIKKILLLVVTLISISIIPGMMITTQAARPEEFFIVAENPISIPPIPGTTVTNQKEIWDTFTLTWEITDSNVEIDGYEIISGIITQVTTSYVLFIKSDVAYYYSTFEIRSTDDTLLTSGNLNLIMRDYSDYENVQTTCHFMGRGLMNIVGTQKAIGHSMVMRLEGTVW